MPIIGSKIETTHANFGNMVTQNCLLVDKTKLIKEFWGGQQVSLITRMRRSGKTLNMSMLQHFFAADVCGVPTKDMFKQFAIAQEDKGEFVEKHQGKYPVIFATFKDIKESSYQAAVNQIKILIQNLFDEHDAVLQSPKLSEINKKIFENYLSGSVNNEELQAAILFLSKCLYKVYGKKVIILIDEYDAPLTNSYAHKYLEQLSNFMRNIFSSVFKDNNYLEKGLLTGILRVSKNNILSGLNNLKVYTLLNKNYDQYFGFTDNEIIELVAKEGITDSLQGIKNFYNGYQIGHSVIYNPWSVMNYFTEKQLGPYWVLTSNDQLLKDVLTRSDGETRKKLECLMQGEEVSGEVNVNLRYEDLIERPDSLWTLLVFCGYLTVCESKPVLDRFVCKLRIPNEEVLIQYKSIFIDWLKERIGEHRYHSILKTLTEGKIEEFTEALGDYLMESLSFMDVSGDKKSEIFYHGFVAALIASLRDTHYIDSNKESGLGRYDILIMPKNTVNSIAIILEFKHTKRSQDIEVIAKTALQQINESKYDTQIKRYPHIKKIIKVGMAFSEKSVVSVYQEDEIIAHKVSEPRVFKLLRDDDLAATNAEEKLTSSSSIHKASAVTKRSASNELIRRQDDGNESFSQGEITNKKQRYSQREVNTSISSSSITLGSIGFFPSNDTSGSDTQVVNDTADESNHEMQSNTI
ncbi:MAG TPA: AAA family ATPase [Gammaproteobacteria bacterium]|nr:AAA family ATPase [Gammaproteobacteria bacterium]